MDIRDFASRLKPFVPYGLVEWRRKRLGFYAGLSKHTAVNQAPTLPSRELDELLPGISTIDVLLPVVEVLRRDFMTSPIRELAVLSAVCRHIDARRMFEFGTYVGSASLAMAMNSSAEAVIDTVDFAPSERPDGYPAFEVGQCFKNGPYATKIRQHYGDCRQMDLSELVGEIDLVFIDAEHTYEAVRDDSSRALNLVRDGGIIIWDDYLYSAEHPECAGVAQFLSELARERECVHILGTRLAICLT